MGFSTKYHVTLLCLNMKKSVLKYLTVIRSLFLQQEMTKKTKNAFLMNKASSKVLYSAIWGFSSKLERPMAWRPEQKVDKKRIKSKPFPTA